VQIFAAAEPSEAQLAVIPTQESVGDVESAGAVELD
jgi:hypothetical protein